MGTLKMTMASVLVLLAMAFVLAGCPETRRGVGRDVQETGERIER